MSRRRRDRAWRQRCRRDRVSNLLREQVLEDILELERYAKARGHSLVELAIAWLAAHQPVASVIAGATSPAQVAANAAGASWTLSAEEVAEVAELAPAL